MASRDEILARLRAAANPFPAAPPRPKHYLTVAPVPDESPAGLLRQFQFELDRLMGKSYLVEGDSGARACVLDQLRQQGTNHLLAWDFAHIPVAGLEDAIRKEGIEITHPVTQDEFRQETIAHIQGAQVGLTGADAAIAATGTLAFSTGPGKGRIPTVLAPVHLAVIEAAQIIPRLEDWVARQRAAGLEGIRRAANICLISGPSRTGDIEMELILGVHGPREVIVIIKQ
jgi:L-lactate dehydrogenase complex protein LldG